MGHARGAGESECRLVTDTAHSGVSEGHEEHENGREEGQKKLQRCTLILYVCPCVFVRGMSAKGLQMDIDDTGTIEYSEFISAALLATNAIAKEDLIDAFNKMDTDSDGAVSSKELLTVLKDYASEQEAKNMINDMEQHHTAEQDGKITRTEFMTAIWTKSGAMEEEVLSAEVSGKQSS